MTAILEHATAAIPPEYIHLQIDGGDPIYRERVYCYELYHQMRSIWPAGTPFYLNGEIDKAAHPILVELGAAYAKPDLLVHQPGYMVGNYAIIEVKSARPPLSGIRKDLETLALFRTKVGYKRAIYLLFGNEVNDALLARIEGASKVASKDIPVEIWFHPKPSASAFQVALLGKITA
ncbi:hypothetical protein MesoLj113b_34230 [Mesorhizobium sp. 113-3-3]|nr:hypothetical protein MesoLj113b_34230 [Mesorhizobium sp. 113-3-3]